MQSCAPHMSYLPSGERHLESNPPLKARLRRNHYEFQPYTGETSNSTFADRERRESNASDDSALSGMTLSSHRGGTWVSTRRRSSIGDRMSDAMTRMRGALGGRKSRDVMNEDNPANLQERRWAFSFARICVFLVSLGVANVVSSHAFSSNSFYLTSSYGIYMLFCDFAMGLQMGPSLLDHSDCFCVMTSIDGNQQLILAQAGNHSCVRAKSFTPLQTTQKVFAKKEVLEKRPISYDSDGDELVNIFMGHPPESVRSYSFKKRLICKSSTYFASIFKNANTLHLPYAESYRFYIFELWLKGRNLKRISGLFFEGKLDFRTLARVYQIAYEYKVPLLKDICVDIVIDWIKAHKYRSPPWYFKGRILASVPEYSLMDKLLDDIKEYNDDKALMADVRSSLSKTFLGGVVAAMRFWPKAIGPSPSCHLLRNPCIYHEHRDDWPSCKD
ncbi:hypothetical protein L228DRAFT_236693 [Xylona heveae TC161]|uniref:BTB domain-containing protein n=1 Tax=Xylona heveae (strain CBS 132557 / TC161) TaxID=1328760 RepID=A0A165J1K1_XYLHT|nr:hypothetical protein L228DRAFT_236693 [Xylona heveae TC161]KZF25618.1 hypothetical protein L228DRAFT_236693 [Xylona heveae TC161]